MANGLGFGGAIRRHTKKLTMRLRRSPSETLLVGPGRRRARLRCGGAGEVGGSPLHCLKQSYCIARRRREKMLIASQRQPTEAWRCRNTANVGPKPVLQTATCGLKPVLQTATLWFKPVLQTAKLGFKPACRISTFGLKPCAKPRHQGLNPLAKPRKHKSGV